MVKNATKATLMKKNHNKNKTKESQYEKLIFYKNKFGVDKLGLMTNQAWIDDPKRLTFTFSRYKFISKMFEGLDKVLEIGCADAFASRIVQQSVDSLTVIDFDPLFIDDVKQRIHPNWPLKAHVHNILDSHFNDKFDGIFALDVLEHIDPDSEDIFIKNIIKSLNKNGSLIIGIPSLESQIYASDISKEGHVNCKTMPDLKILLSKYFYNVYMFSMNDEVLHTGYHKMSNYIFALCANSRSNL